MHSARRRTDKLRFVLANDQDPRLNAGDFSCRPDQIDCYASSNIPFTISYIVDQS